MSNSFISSSGERCLFSVRVLSIVTPSSSYLLTPSSVMLSQQIFNCSSFSLCCVGICLVIIRINFVLHDVLRTRLVLIDHFAIEAISMQALVRCLTCQLRRD